jgi:hypothetical protein
MDTITCPKCSKLNPTPSGVAMEACPSCGAIYAKAKPPREPTPRPSGHALVPSQLLRPAKPPYRLPDPIARVMWLYIIPASAATAIAGEGELPGDVSVTLTATPSVNLVPGERIQFTVTATNLGPSEIAQPFILSSSMIMGELDTGSTESSDCEVVTEVVDLRNGGSYYLLNWEVIGLPGSPQSLAVGDTATCHFSEAITSFAPPSLQFSMGLADYGRIPTRTTTALLYCCSERPFRPRL